MKKILFFGIAFSGILTYQVVTAQQNCSKVHNFCKTAIPEEEQTKDWSMDNQSKSATFEKGKTYEMSFIAYQDFVYRLSTCTDVVEGGEKINFEISRMELVRKNDNAGNQRLFKEKVVVYNNNTENMKGFYKFRVEKTEKLFVKVNIPSSGKSENKSLTDSEYVCVGVLIEHRRAAKVGF